jgi:hypothetical protein
MSSLGANSYGGNITADKITAQNVDIPYAGVGAVSSDITFANNGQALPPKGLYTVNTTGGNTTMSLGDGEKLGDAVEVIYFHSGGNSFTLNVTLSGAPKTIVTGPAHSGQYYKLIWATSGALTPGWIVAARQSLVDAADNAVDGLPVIA